MSDFESKAHNVYFSANYMPTQKLRVFATVNYNLSEAGYKDVIMPDSTAIAELIPDAFFAGHDWDYSAMPDYSDFDYQFLRLSVGGEYMLTPTVTLTADVDFADLKDKGIYVYGDETGSFLMLRSGVKIDF